MKTERGDEGIALVLVLLFVIVSGVLVTALLTQSFSTFSAARAANSAEQRVYAAGGGVDWGIQQVRQGILVNGARACTSPGPAETLATALPIGSQQVTVTCEVLGGGHEVGAGGWAVFITDPAGGVTTSASPRGDREIAGPVYNAGAWNLAPGTRLVMDRGEVVSGAAGCANAPELLREAPGPAFACAPEPLATPPVPVDLTAALAGLGDASSQGTTNQQCRSFAPGVYRTPPQFLPNRDTDGNPNGVINYLESGVYVFDWATAAPDALRDVTVVGGIPAPIGPVNAPDPAWETPILAVGDLGLAGCPEEDGQTAPHFGVTIVLRGEGDLALSGTSAVELFSYVDLAGQPGGGVSIVREPAPAKVNPPLVAVSTALGDDAAMAVHGTVYVPDRAVHLAALGVAVLSGGVVTADLQLDAGDAGADGPLPPVVSNTEGAGQRTIRVVALTNQTATEREMTATATINIDNSGARTLEVDGWTVSP